MEKQFLTTKPAAVDFIKSLFYAWNISIVVVAIFLAWAYFFTDGGVYPFFRGGR